MVATEKTGLIAYLAILAIIALQRLIELRLSRRNTLRALDAGAVEVGTSHYPWMVVLHGAFLIACGLEVWLLERPLIIPLAVAMAVVLLIATTLRYAAITTLGERWTTRVFRWPDRPLIRRGPYRWLRHPNYLAVILEIAALPLLHSAWTTAVLFSVLNGWLLSVRVRIENDALAHPDPDPHRDNRRHREDRPE